MKHSLPVDWDWEKKPKRLVKSQDKTGKHKKSIYNMLSEYEEDSDNDDNEVEFSYETNDNTKQR